MDREFQDELADIEAEVHDGLRHRKFLAEHAVIPLCQYLVLPAFENPVSWDLLGVVSRRAGGGEMRLYRSCWRKDQDLEAFRSPVERLKRPRPFSPRVEVEWMPIERDRVEALIARFQSIRVPLVVERPHTGLDGVIFELSLGWFFCSARIGWWVELPDEWQELQPLVAALEQLIEESWSTRQTPDDASTGGGR
jgi:hypothetical protein